MNLTLDSRNRINAKPPNSCKFRMQDGVQATKLELVSFQFANFLHNVTSSSNQLYIDSALAAEINAGFWDTTDFVTELNTQLKAHFATVDDVVTLNPLSNSLDWDLPS